MFVICIVYEYVDGFDVCFDVCDDVVDVCEVGYVEYVCDGCLCG